MMSPHVRDTFSASFLIRNVGQDLRAKGGDGSWLSAYKTLDDPRPASFNYHANAGKVFKKVPLFFL